MTKEPLITQRCVRSLPKAMQVGIGGTTRRVIDLAAEQARSIVEQREREQLAEFMESSQKRGDDQ